MPSDTMSNSWSQHLRGTHRGPRAGRLARMASKSPSRSFSSGSNSRGAPARAEPSYVAQRVSVGPTWAQRRLDHLNSKVKPSLHCPGELLRPRDHMAATWAAGSQQIPKHGCGSSSAPWGIQLLEDQAWRGTCEPLSLATGFAGLQPLFSRPVKSRAAFPCLSSSTLVRRRSGEQAHGSSLLRAEKSSLLIQLL